MEVEANGMTFGELWVPGGIVALNRDGVVGEGLKLGEECRIEGFRLFDPMRHKVTLPDIKTREYDVSYPRLQSHMTSFIRITFMKCDLK